jgi:hypothetical protein
MKQRSFRFSALAVAACGALVNPAHALEAATTGSQATQATVGAINSKVDVTNNFINAMMKCNAARKFYAPSDPKKDSDGCVGVGDYDLNMASGSNVNLANGLMKGAQTGTSDWTGTFSGPSLGVLGKGGSYGVYGYASGSNSGDSVGVYGYAATSTGWGGYFYSPASGGGGVMIYNANNNARLCLNGSCTMSVAHTVNVRSSSAYAWRWPAAGVGCASNEIVTGGGGYCTSGSGDMRMIYSIPNGNGWYVACDTSLSQYATAAVYAMCLVK